MRYLRCLISKPGLLENTVFEFDQNPVIVFGRNGSGKTLIAKALIDALFRKLSGLTAVAEDAWDSLYIDLNLSLDDDTAYRVVNNGNRHYTVYLLKEGEEDVIYSERKDDSADSIHDPRYSRLEDFTRMIDGSTFLTSSFIPSPADITSWESVSYDSLKSMMMNDRTVCCRSYSGAGRGDATPWAKQEALIHDLEQEQRRNLKQIQLIDVSRNRLDKLVREKKSINREIREINGTQDSLSRQKDILNTIIADLKEIETLNKELEDLRTTLLEEEETAKLAGDIKKEIETHYPHLQKIGIDDIPSLEELQELFNGIKNLNERIDTTRFTRKIKLKRLITITIGVVIAAGISVTAILLGSRPQQPVNYNMIIGIAASSAAIIAGLFIYHLATSRKKELERLNGEKMQLENSLKEKIKGNRVDYDGEKVHELYDFLLQYFEDYLEFNEKTRDYNRLRNTLKDSRYFDEIAEKLDKLKSDVDDIKKRIESSVESLEIVKNIEINENEIQNVIAGIDSEIESNILKIQDKERILKQIDNEIQAQPDSRDELKSLTRQKSAADKKVKALHAKRNAMKFVLDAMEEAEKRRENKQMKKLVKNTLEKFNYLTGNQHITKIDERMINEILLKGTTPPEMNPAVTHSIMMSAKFSMTDIIANGGVTLPLIIDDPFYNMDEARVKRFRDLVAEAAKDRQVILFTHQKDTRDWGKFIEL